MTIKELTELYGEPFYALELISNKDCKSLKPFKWQGDTDEAIKYLKKKMSSFFKFTWNEGSSILNDTFYNNRKEKIYG